VKRLYGRREYLGKQEKLGKYKGAGRRVREGAWGRG